MAARVNVVASSLRGASPQSGRVNNVADAALVNLYQGKESSAGVIDPLSRKLQSRPPQRAADNRQRQEEHSQSVSVCASSGLECPKPL